MDLLDQVRDNVDITSSLYIIKKYADLYDIPLRLDGLTQDVTLIIKD
jgi:hypothetical protein